MANPIPMVYDDLRGPEGRMEWELFRVEWRGGWSTLQEEATLPEAGAARRLPVLFAIMVDFPVSSIRPPWAVRWAVGAPVAAAACVVFFARAWGVPWHGYSVAAVAVVAWMLAARLQWPMLEPGRERWAVAGALVVAGGLVFYWAGWWLPRGLVLAALPVVALAAMEGWVGRGRIGPAFRRLMRAAIFAAGVWLPLVWWQPRGLLGEFGRLENLAFLALLVLVGWARPVGGVVDRRQVVRAALALAAVAVAGSIFAWVGELNAPRTVYQGVAIGALALAAGVGVPWCRAPKRSVAAWWPEAALVIMALTTWVG